MLWLAARRFSFWYWNCMIKVTIVPGRESSSHGDLLRYQSHVMADQVQVVDQYQYQHHQYDQYQYHQYQLWPINSRWVIIISNSCSYYQSSQLFLFNVQLPAGRNCRLPESRCRNFWFHSLDYRHMNYFFSFSFQEAVDCEPHGGCGWHHFVGRGDHQYHCHDRHQLHHQQHHRHYHHQHHDHNDCRLASCASLGEESP